MSAARVRFDGDCQVAALVYEAGEEPDALLSAFSADLTNRGVNVRGVLQARAEDGASLADSLCFFPGGPTLSVPKCGTRAHHSPALWSGALHAAERFLLAAVEAQPDLLVINRFGAAECAGGGLVPVICEAIMRDVPVLVPVPSWRFTDWLALSEGMTVKLACNRRSLEGWWRGLSCVPFPSLADSFCARAK
ncbi:hypothetical protein GCM10007301_32640 [Azorhizobium oxalatiphilum]|uniref:DUF2478 domain-containing protein n=1 Tax=Azorhizobium oxalatiphilum TaxID=980631 RepID=A0A917C3N2_9HYPH|nr:DUF2478 domain-containing protein [Azorhizobium oxalatiphilum]GGF70342.1 hypothetical protein GCM10007301_32640 [Azorhizobium oxalatiphilum]